MKIKCFVTMKISSQKMLWSYSQNIIVVKSSKWNVLDCRQNMKLLFSTRAIKKSFFFYFIKFLK